MSTKLSMTHPIFHTSAAVLIMALTLGCGSTKETPISEAKQLLFKKDFQGALSKVDGILKLNPDDYEAIVLRGQINVKSGREKEALADFTSAILKQPNQAEAYARRMELYTSQAESAIYDGANGKEESIRLYALANADRDRYLELDIDARDTLKDKPKSDVAEFLKTPIPGYDPLAKESIEKKIDERIDPNKVSDADMFAAESNGEPSDGFRDPFNPVKSADERTNDSADLTSNTSDAGADQSDVSSEEQITKQDLLAGNNGDVEDPPLPHDTNQEEELPSVPEPVTRFDMGSFQPILPDPTGLGGDRLGGDQGYARFDIPERRTTGITQQELETEEPQQPQQPASPWTLPSYRTSPYLSGGFSNPNGTQVRSTGIISSPRAGNRARPAGFGGPSAAVPVPGQTLRSPYLAGPAGFLPPSAQGQFGPRLGPSGPSTESSTAPSDERRLPIPNRKNLEGTPVISTALPNTTRYHGGVNQPPAQINQFDPRNSPFAQQPATLKGLPELPTQQSIDQ